MMASTPCDTTPPDCALHNPWHLIPYQQQQETHNTIAATSTIPCKAVPRGIGGVEGSGGGWEGPGGSDDVVASLHLAVHRTAADDRIRIRVLRACCKKTTACHARQHFVGFGVAVHVDLGY